jgi:hypothetical protein
VSPGSRGEFSRLSLEGQRYIMRNRIRISATTLAFVQATRDHVKGDMFERGNKLRFETTWLDKQR